MVYLLWKDVTQLSDSIIPSFSHSKWTVTYDVSKSYLTLITRLNKAHHCSICRLMWLCRTIGTKVTLAWQRTFSSVTKSRFDLKFLEWHLMRFLQTSRKEKVKNKVSLWEVTIEMLFLNFKCVLYFLYFYLLHILWPLF